MRSTPLLGLLVALPPLLLTSCNLVGYGAVSIRPSSGWADGCTAVKISGHGFEDSVTATVGGAAVTDLALPPDVEDSLDVGFWFTAVTPAGTNGASDVVVTNGDEEDTIPEAFYYLTCPAAPYPEALVPEAGVASGDSVSFHGCGLDAGAMKVEIRDPNGVQADTQVDLTSACLTAHVSFAAPDLPDGDYLVYITDGAGSDLYPIPCDTGDTGTACDAPFTLTYGGAE